MIRVKLKLRMQMRTKMEMETKREEIGKEMRDDARDEIRNQMRDSKDNPVPSLGLFVHALIWMAFTRFVARDFSGGDKFRSEVNQITRGNILSNCMTICFGPFSF